MGFVSQDSDVLVSQGSLGETRTNWKGSLTMFISVANKENVNSATIVWTITEIRLNPGSLQELLKSYLIMRNLAQTFPYGLGIWKAMQRNAWNDIANWRTEQLNSFTKWRLHALTTTNSRRRNGICRRIAPDRACDKDLVRLISRIPHTCEFKHCWQMGNTAQQCWLGLFQDCDFAGDLEDSKSTSGGLLCIFGSHTFVPMSRMCKKQTSVSRSSTEAEVVSLDASSRMNGIPSSWSLGFGYCSISVFTEPTNNTKDQVRSNSSRDTTWNKHTQIQTKVPIHHDNLKLRNIDNVSSKAKSSQFGAMLYILKTAKKWLKWSSKAEVQQRRILNPQSCQIRYMTPNINSQTFWPKDISHVISGIIFFICETSASHCILLCCSQNFSLDQLHQKDGENDARTERRRKDRGKVKTDDELGLACLDKFFDCAESDCVEKPGDTHRTLSKWLVKYRKTWSKIIHSKRTVEFWRMAKRCSTGCRYGETRSDTRRPRTPQFTWRFNMYQEKRRFTKHKNRRKNDIWPHNLHISTDFVLHMESQSERWNERPRCEHKHMEYIFPYTLPAAVHLGLNFSENLGSTKYQPVKSVSQLFQVTWKMITDQTEITGITTIDRRQRMWRETTLLTDRQSCSVCNCKNRRLFWLSAKSGRYQHWTSHSMGQQEEMVFWKHVFCFSRKNWIWSTGTNGVPVEKFPSIL